MYELSFGEWLSRRRKAFGLTQNDLAQKINCALVTVRKIEAEQRRPSVQIAEKISQILEIPSVEQSAFLRFARGDWRSNSTMEMIPSPWKSIAPSIPFQMPVPQTTLIGRETELNDVSGYLLDENTHLITLVGAPGVGKSRLSFEIIHRMSHVFPSGVSALTLTDFNEPDLLEAALLRAIGIDTFDDQFHIQEHKSEITTGQRLLVLDNVEHLVSVVGRLVYNLNQTCPNIKILATSREPLHVPGEVIYMLSPLELPARHHLRSTSVEVRRQSASLKLFEECARVYQPDFMINSGNIHEVTAICEHLDGLPLAIELLASRIHLMTPQSLLAHLSGQFVLQSAVPRYLPEYHKSLEQAIGRSYALLSLDEKRLFTYLSILNGSFSLEMVESAFSATPPHNIIADLISSLLEKSLIHRTIGRHGEPHFTMLRVIQQFAAEHLKDFDQDAVASFQFPPDYLRYSSSVQVNNPDLGKRASK